MNLSIQQISVSPLYLSPDDQKIGKVEFSSTCWIMLVAGDDIADTNDIIKLADHFAQEIKKVAQVIFIFTEKAKEGLKFQRHSMTPATVRFDQILTFVTYDNCYLI